MNIPNVDKVQITAFPMLNYIYVLPAQQMRILHMQTYMRNLSKNSSKDCLKMKAPPSFPAPTGWSVSDRSKVTGWGV